MAQLRQEYAQLTANGAEVVVIGPEDRRAFERQWQKEHFTFVGLPVPQERLLRLFSAAQGESAPVARAPDWVLIDKEGRVRHAQHRSWAGGAADGGVLEALQALTQGL
jgi:peroxiredoxin